MVGFTFLPQGIRVRSRWFPVLKMEWISGASLEKYIQQNLGNPRAILKLAERWKKLIRALARAGISHGDLQHGNVLVIGGKLCLIDYDGMFVPALAGYRSHERGHENYQHPRRGDEFGPGLDNFSAWVIYLSIVAVAYEPKLWAEFDGGDDCLLFRRRDFLERDRSRLVQALLCSNERRIRRLTSWFIRLMDYPSQQVPPLGARRVRLLATQVVAEPRLTALPGSGRPGRIAAVATSRLGAPGQSITPRKRPRRVAALAILGVGIALWVTVCHIDTAKAPRTLDAMETVHPRSDASVGTGAAADAAPHMQSVVVLSDGAELFESASRTGKASPLRGGAIVTILAESETWYQVRTARGDGWIEKQQARRARDDDHERAGGEL